MLISVGYMDPGNWSTDLSAGAGFKYNVLFIVGLASLMAIPRRVEPIRIRLTQPGARQHVDTSLDA